MNETNIVDTSNGFKGPNGLKGPNGPHDFLSNDIYFSADYGNTNQRFRKRCKTCACYCLGFSLFTITSSLFFIVGYTYHDNLHCNITSF